MSEARVIKRYANRKLYDTQHSRYVTLDQISEMIRNGDDVKIIDNKTKEDLTSVTLAQIIFEEEKKQRSFLPLQAMRNIIQNGGESFAQLVSEAQRRVTSILPKKHASDELDDDEDGSGEVHPEGTVSIGDDETYGGMTRRPHQLGTLREFREWVQQSQRTIDEWQKRVDGRIRTAVDAITPFAGLREDVKVLADRIAQLEDKLQEIAEEHDDEEDAYVAHMGPRPVAPVEPLAADPDSDDADEGDDPDDADTGRAEGGNKL